MEMVLQKILFLVAKEAGVKPEKIQNSDLYARPDVRIARLVFVRIAKESGRHLGEIAQFTGSPFYTVRDQYRAARPSVLRPDPRFAALYLRVCMLLGHKPRPLYIDPLKTRKPKPKEPEAAPDTPTATDVNYMGWRFTAEEMQKAYALIRRLSENPII